MNGYKIPGPGKYRTRGEKEVLVTPRKGEDFVWTCKTLEGDEYIVTDQGFLWANQMETGFDIIGPAAEPEQPETKTLRDEFAMAALTGLLTWAHTRQPIDEPADQIAEIAYELADAMLSARRQP